MILETINTIMYVSLEMHVIVDNMCCTVGAHMMCHIAFEIMSDHCNVLCHLPHYLCKECLEITTIINLTLKR